MFDDRLDDGVAAGRPHAAAHGRRHFIATTLIAAALGASALGAHAAGTTQRPAGVAAAPRTLLVVGDSLSAEYGLRRGTGWVPLLAARLKDEGLPVEVINASISGDTTSGGRSRLAALLRQHQPRWLVIELGANDALRGLPLKDTEANLDAMAQAGRAAGAGLVLVGIQVPPNYGRRYTEEFAGMYERVAARHQAALVPFLLKGVADDPDPLRWFQADRIHPNEAAQPRLLDNVWQVVAPLLKGEAQKRRAASRRTPATTGAP